MNLFNDSLKRFLFRGGLVCSVLISGIVCGQGSATYPYVDPIAGRSGMTSGLENGTTASTLNLMKVRASAHESEREAAAAALARSAESAIEEQRLNAALDKARRIRQAKREASEQLKWQRIRAQNAYNKVSSSEMAAWKDSNGNVKVAQGGLPPSFVQSIQANEAARAAELSAQKKGFSPLKGISQKVSKAVGVDEPLSSTGLSSPKPLPPAVLDDEGEKSGLFGLKIPKIKGPKLPFSKIGNKGSNSVASGPQQPQFPTTPAPAQVRPQTVPASAVLTTASQPKPRKPAAAPSQTNSGSALRKAAPRPQPVATQPAPAIKSSERKTLFSKKRGSSNSSPKKFGFGRKEPEPEISSGLFPSGIVSGEPSAPPQPSSNQRLVSLPNSQPQAKKKRFSLSMPKLPSPKTTSKSSLGVSPSSAINRNGNNFYVVGASSQFMKYGVSRTQTSISAIRPGTIVMMTKPGTEWATVQLRDGSSGVIQTKNLRSATASEVPGNFAPAQANYATKLRDEVNQN